MKANSNDYINYEKERLRELRIEIETHNSNPKNKKKLIFPPDYKESQLLRFLQATGYNYSKTIEIVIENIEWREKLIPPIITPKVIELLNCGFMYIHGRDNNYRPIMVINADVFLRLKDNYVYDDWLLCIIFIMEYLIEKMLIPGQVENWTMISNFKSVSLLFPPAEMKKFMAVLQSNYRCRLYVNYIIGMSGILRGIWNIVKAFLDEATVNKVRFLTDETMDDIFTFINEEQVEQKFGGKAKNIVPGGNNIFPPLMPSKNYLKQNDDISKMLVKESKYKELYKLGKLTQVSQFYIDKWNKEELEENQKIMKIKLEEEAKVQVLSYEASTEAEIKDNESLSKVNARGSHNINFIEKEHLNSHNSYIFTMNSKLNKGKKHKQNSLKKHLTGKDDFNPSPYLFLSYDKNEKSKKFL